MYLLQYRGFISCQTKVRRTCSLLLQNCSLNSNKVTIYSCVKCHKRSGSMSQVTEGIHGTFRQLVKTEAKTFSLNHVRMRPFSLKATKFDSFYRNWDMWKFWCFLGGTLFGAIMLMESGLQATSSVEEESQDDGKKPFKDKDDGKYNPGEENLLEEKIRYCRFLVKQFMSSTRLGIPGVSVAVAIDGETVWTEGFGYADLENHLPFTPETVLRIASISKPITMAAVANLWEQGLLDLDKPVQYYVPEFPVKTWNGEKVTITVRHLLSHHGGIRHYDILSKTVKDLKNDINEDVIHGHRHPFFSELYNMKKYNSVTESLGLFKDDALVTKPGSKYVYSSFGWILVSAVVEKLAKKSIEECLKTVLHDLGMDNTYLDEAAPIIYNRARHYDIRKGRLVNSPYIDASYKWGSEGLLSNVLDLVKFGNAMLYSYQADSYYDNGVSACPGYLKSDTVKLMWTRTHDGRDIVPGLGWKLESLKRRTNRDKGDVFIAFHSGGAVGASSFLVIAPGRISGGTREGEETGIVQSQISHRLSKAASDQGLHYLGDKGSHSSDLNLNDIKRRPKGVVVSVMVNLDSDFILGSLKKLVDKIVLEFVDS